MTTDSQKKQYHLKMITEHCSEVYAKGAEFYNIGWALGEDFIHSKTDQGRLFTEVDLETGEISHEWEDQ